MSEDVTAGTERAAEAVDVGEYCRSIEDHLTRVNGGHLVRVVGPGFDLVRSWAESGIPLSVVYRGIEQKADRARARRSSPGRPPRPLRIEFCEGDVLDLFESWRRAVGVPATGPTEPAGHESQSPAKRAPSVAKHLDRVIDRLSRVAGRTDVPSSLVESLTMLLDAVSSLREEAKAARPGGSIELSGRLPPLDGQMMTAVRRAAPPEMLDALTKEAAHDLSPFQARLTPEAWRQAVDLTVDRLLRDRFGLPTIVMGLKTA